MQEKANRHNDAPNRAQPIKHSFAFFVAHDTDEEERESNDQMT